MAHFRIAGLLGVLAAFAFAAPAHAGGDKSWICHGTGQADHPYALIDAPTNSTHWTKHQGKDKAPDKDRTCDGKPTPPFTGQISLGIEPITATCANGEFGVDGWTLTVELFNQGEQVSSDSATRPPVCVPITSGPAGPPGPEGPQGVQGPPGPAIVSPVIVPAPANFRRCHSRRTVTITLPRPIMRALHGSSTIRTIVAGKWLRLDVRNGKITASFRGVREGTSSVTIRIRAADHRLLTMTRFYTLCREGALGNTNVPPRTGE